LSLLLARLIATCVDYFIDQLTGCDSPRYTHITEARYKALQFPPKNKIPLKMSGICPLFEDSTAP
jgi:hypothetical protein